MSIDTKQMIHIAIEAVVLTSVSAYFMHKNKQLSEHIDQLEAKIQQQEEILQNHDNLILKLLNTVNNINLGQIPQMINPVVQNIDQSNQIMNPFDSFISTDQPSTNSVIKLSTDGIDHKNSANASVIKKQKVKKPIQKLPENITSSKKVILMMSTQPMLNLVKPEYKQENKVEEIEDEDEEIEDEDYIIPKNKIKLDQLIDINKIESENELDDELEEELKDLE